MKKNSEERVKSPYNRWQRTDGLPVVLEYTLFASRHAFAHVEYRCAFWQMGLDCLVKNERLASASHIAVDDQDSHTGSTEGSAVACTGLSHWLACTAIVWA